MSDRRSIRPGQRFLIHFTIHVILVLAYFLPGGFIWNRMEPLVGALPFGVFMWWILLPILIIVNMALYVRAHWAEDKLVTSEVRAGVTVHEAEQAVADEDLDSAQRRTEGEGGAGS